LIEVDTHGYRYDQRSLAHALRQNTGRVMAVIAYAGDSRTQTVDDLRAVHDTVRAADERIWLHADACWGLVCALSDELRMKIDGIGEYDSITVDPHKVMAVPYGLSALLVGNPADLRMISTYSDLIMQEEFAFGQVTPFIGSKSWLSLKLWMMMRAHGRSGLARIVTRRIALVERFVALVDAHPRLVRLNDPDLAAVVFMYLPGGTDRDARDVDRLNQVNQWIHQQMLAEGTWHLHQFSIADDTGRIHRGATLYPLRFMAGNPRIEYAHMVGVLEYVLALGQRWEKEHQP
jgi:L-2,4-diaminobutyrate decarboxylase